MSELKLYLPQDPLVEHDIEQKSPEWFALRVNKRTGSESSIAMGINPYTKRDELVIARATGGQVERSEYVTNVIMAHGNNTEEEGRNHYEEEFGRMMSPAVFTRGAYLASPDGVERENGVVTRAYEVKCPHSRRRSKRWQAALKGEILPHDLAQLAVQYAVMQVPIDFYVYIPAENGLPAEARLITYDGPSVGEWAAIEEAWDTFELDVLSVAARIGRGEVVGSVSKDERSDEAWSEAAEAFLSLTAEFDILQEQLERARQDLILLSAGKDATGAGVRVTHSERAGSTDWKQAFAAVAPADFDLKPYKKDPTAVTTVAPIFKKGKK